jgi:hypothetical protein
MPRPLPIILVLLALIAAMVWLPQRFNPMANAFQAGPVTPQHPPPTTPIEPISEDDPSVHEVLAHLRTAYAEAGTYRDEGVVEIVFRKPAGVGEFAEYRPFRTHFIRPAHFHFEYKNTPHPSAKSFRMRHRYVVWQNGEAVRSWWTIQPEVREWDSLNSGLGAAVGVSGGSSSTVAGLLMPGEMPFGGGIHLGQPVLAGVQDVGGAACYRIEDARPRHHDTLILWVDTESFLIRRIYHVLTLDGNVVEQMTVYEGEANVEVDPVRFEFTPPK